MQQRKKVKSVNRFVGKTGSARTIDDKFRATDVMVPVFITKIHKHTTERDITEYIRNKTQENIIMEKITTLKENNYNAYNFFCVRIKTISVFR